jgi:hypothetical protein
MIYTKRTLAVYLSLQDLKKMHIKSFTEKCYCNQFFTCICGKKPQRPLRCSACNMRVYCSRACQEKDWKKHKRTCKTKIITRAMIEQIKSENECRGCYINRSVFLLNLSNRIFTKHNSLPELPEGIRSSGPYLVCIASSHIEFFCLPFKYITDNVDWKNRQIIYYIDAMDNYHTIAFEFLERKLICMDDNPIIQLGKDFNEHPGYCLPEIHNTPLLEQNAIYSKKDHKFTNITELRSVKN